MSVQKLYAAKVFDQDGTTFLSNLTTGHPADSTLPHLKNVPTFRSRINGGLGECVLDLHYPFDAFDADVVNFLNIVEIHASKVDEDSMTTVSDQIYKGFCSRIEPYSEGSSEGVRMTLLGLGSLTTASFYKTGGNLEVSHGLQDPETIGRAIITHFNTVYGGSLLSYSDDTTDNVGQNVSVTFTDQKWFDCLRKVGELAGTGWWWKIDELGLYWLKAKPSSPTHQFTIGREIASITATKDAEGVVNDLYVRRSGGTETTYSDATSQVTYGTGSPATGKRSKTITDSSLDTEAAADARGEKEIEDNKDAKLRAILTLNQKYDLESVKVGETCIILNHDLPVSFLPQNLLIVGLTYLGDSMTVELEGVDSDLGLALEGFVG